MPQANGVGGPGAPILMQLIPVGGVNNPQPIAAGGQAGKTRVKHSVPFNGNPTPTRTDPSLHSVPFNGNPTPTRTDPSLVTGEDEESSGTDSDVKITI
ncbi:hypothetical protein DPEC_G00192610 [Dallia pectoralis]|uniref:Uncharacterized protein n=1 Tax=Dallia pectoralis TaxID=75939 RepID=A0ACC2GC17_DALPE|nr:hypothetical protein DPEC_G00192610 [Dallia pectoralis]